MSKPNAIYVDELVAAPRSHKWKFPTACHLCCEPGNEEGLHVFAASIGMKRAWFQTSGIAPHYDLNESRRKAAVKAGAVEIHRRQMCALLGRWRVHRGFATLPVHKTLGDEFPAPMIAQGELAL